MNNQISIDEFIEKLVKGLQDHYKEGYSVRSSVVQKNNSTIRHGIIVAKDGEMISPSIYVDAMYGEYLEGEPLACILRRFIAIRDVNQLHNDMDMSFIDDYEQVKGKLGIKIINKDMNKDILKDVPYIDYADLAVVFLVLVEGEEIGSGSILIKNRQMKIWGVDTDTLYEDAVTQMAYRFPAYLRGMLELLEEIYIEENGNVNTDELRNALMAPARENMNEINNKNLQMYVLTNKAKWFGASAIVYPDMLEHLADEMGGAYYLIPSSIHEVIIIPKVKGDAGGECLSRLVKEVNATQLQREEILSDHAYEYIPDEKRLLPLEASA